MQIELTAKEFPKKSVSCEFIRVINLNKLTHLVREKYVPLLDSVLPMPVRGSVRRATLAHPYLSPFCHIELFFLTDAIQIYIFPSSRSLRRKSLPFISIGTRSFAK